MTQFTWKPVSEYVNPPYKGYTPIVLVGWECTLGDGRTRGVGQYSLGYYCDIRKSWFKNNHDREMFYRQPTHFSIIVQEDIFREIIRLEEYYDDR